MRGVRVHAGGIGGIERRHTGQLLIENASERVKIGARVDTQIHARAEFGRRIDEIRVVPLETGVAQRLGHIGADRIAEARQKRTIVVIHEEAMRCKRAMHDAGRMHLAQRSRERNRTPQKRG